MFSTALPDLEVKSASSNREIKMTKNCILLAGPGGYAFDKTQIIKIEKALKNQDANVIRIGDGASNLNDEAIEKLFNYLQDVREPCLLFIEAHGELKGNEHFINLKGDYSTNSAEFLKTIASKLQGKKIDIFSTACHGGAVCSAAQSILPSGSTYVALAPASEPVSGFDVDRLIDVLETNNLLNENLTAEKLLFVYLTKALENRIPPMFCSSQSGAPLAKKFISHLGKEFSESEKKEIYLHLGNLVSIDKINKLIAIIEKYSDDWSINAKQYGLALAICHSANRNLSFSFKESARRGSDLMDFGLFTPSRFSYQPRMMVSDPIIVDYDELFDLVKKAASKDPLLVEKQFSIKR